MMIFGLRSAVCHACYWRSPERFISCPFKREYRNRENVHRRYQRFERHLQLEGGRFRQRCVWLFRRISLISVGKFPRFVYPGLPDIWGLTGILYCTALNLSIFTSRLNHLQSHERTFWNGTSSEYQVLRTLQCYGRYIFSENHLRWRELLEVNYYEVARLCEIIH